MLNLFCEGLVGLSSTGAREVAVAAATAFGRPVATTTVKSEDWIQRFPLKHIFIPDSPKYKGFW